MGRAALDKAVEAPAVPEVVDNTMFERIVKLHNEAEQLKDKAFGYAKLTVEKVIMVGELLTEQKAILEHGEWLPWIRNLPFSQKTVCNYMRCFQDKAKLVSVTNLKDAYRLIEAPGKGKEAEKKPKDEPKEPEVLSDDQAGEATSHEPEADRGEESVDENHQAEDATTGEAEDREPEFAESEARSPKHALVAVLHTVRDKVEGIQRDCQGYTDMHGTVYKSVLKKFTEKEKSEVRVLLMQFDDIKRIMSTIGKSMGRSWLNNK